MKLFKGFNKNMECCGFKFKEGETYKEDCAELCHSGFHACEYPIDCFKYYSPTDSEYHEVELEDMTDELTSDDSKRVGKRITIGAKLSFKNIVDASINYVYEHIDKNKQQFIVNDNYSAASNTGFQSAASNTGFQSAASNTGFQSAASNTGNYSAASNTGFQSAASNTGFQSAASNTGNYSAASNTGDYSAASNTGDYSAASNTGNYSAASNTGDYSAASNTGDYSAAFVSGKGSVAISLGFQGCAKGALGCWIVLAEWENTHSEMRRKDVKCFYVDGENIKENVYYTMRNGSPIECNFK